MTALSRSRPLFNFLDFLLICVAFAAAIVIYGLLYPINYEVLTTGQLLGRFMTSVATFWVATRVYEGSNSEQVWSRVLDQFCLGTGPNLILQAVFNYFLLLTRSFFMILAGGLLAAILLGVAKKWIYARVDHHREALLLIGFDPVAEAVISLLQVPILGVVGARAPSAFSNIPFLGDMIRLEEILSEQRPTQIVVSKNWASQIPAALLLQCRVRGITVTDAPALYEKLFYRVHCEDLEPAELLLSPALRADHRTMAIQAVYSNLIGTFFLLMFAPALVLGSLGVAIFSRPGPTFETIDCVGFQNIPFRLLRFRTRRMDGSGRLTLVGAVLSRLRLINLPQIINVIRGEMSLFGPRPVRREFSRCLTALIPFYSLRFCVKPGIFGWAQMHLRKRPENEFAQLGYDFYYIKEGSPLLDLGILLGILFNWRNETEVSDAIAFAPTSST